MRMNPRVQGGLGELSAMEWLGRQGWCVFFPVNHSPDVDLVVVRGDEVLTVQVKTSTFFRNDRWCVMLATSGGNQSWTGVVRRFSSTRCDMLFVTVGDGRRWFIPSTAIGAERSTNLGGPKYAEYEVERGVALRDPSLSSRVPAG